MSRPKWALLLPVWLALYCIQCHFCLAANVIHLEDLAQWTLSNIHGNNNVSLDNVKIPSYVLDTLQQRGLINSDYDLAYRSNERDLAWVAKDTWTYTATWNLSSSDLQILSDAYFQLENGDEKGIVKNKTFPENRLQISDRHRYHALLILHGIDTAATITLNNHTLGSIANSHRRHVFEITETVLFSNSTNHHIMNGLEITIQPAAVFAASQAAAFTAHPVPYTKQLGNTGQYNFIRKAASDFGWDWGPSFAPAGISAGIELVLRSGGDGDGGGGGEEENKIKNEEMSTSTATTVPAPVYLMDLGLRQHHFTTNNTILVTADAFFRPLLTSVEVENLVKKEIGGASGVDHSSYFTAFLEITISGPCSSSSSSDSNEEEETSGGEGMLHQPRWSAEKEINFSVDDLLSNTNQYFQKESADWVIRRSIDVLVTPPYQLWWPWDLGSPVLYNVTVTLRSQLRSTKDSTVKDHPVGSGSGNSNGSNSVLQMGRNQEERKKQELEEKQQQADKKDIGVGTAASDGTSADQYQVVHRQIGFRTIELIQDPIYIDPTNTSSTNKKKSKAEVDQGETFYFKVNGVAVFARGANIVPIDLIPTKVTPNRIKHAVSSARDANMNFLRVWGGGRYFPDLFYEECDQSGILVWQEFAYACAMYPATEFYLHEAKEEARQQVLRLNSHPSVALWGGNNENEAAFSWFPETKAHREKYRREYEVLFLRLLREQVLDLDPGAIYVDSSPSNGLVKDTLTTTSTTSTDKKNKNKSNGSAFPFSGENENFKDLIKEERLVKKKWGDVTDPSQGDIHFYDYSSNLLESTTYPQAKFISEFGYMSLPSFDSYAKQSKNEDWVVGSELMEYRMRHGDGLKQIEHQLHMHFLLAKNMRKKAERKDQREEKQQQQRWTSSRLNSSSGGSLLRNSTSSSSEYSIGDIDVFQAYIYLTQLQQALIYETAAIIWRRGKTDPPGAHTAGLLYWQLNDVWAGPSWSGINYDGRWKALHYAARRFFSPIAVFGHRRKKENLESVLPTWSWLIKKKKRGGEGGDEESVQVWVVNDGREDVQGTLEIYAIPFQSNSASEVIDMVSFGETVATAAAAAAAPNSRSSTASTSINDSSINVPGSGSILAWRSNFTDTPWGSVQAAASHVYLQVRFCTAASPAKKTLSKSSIKNFNSGGEERCLDNVMLLEEMKESLLAEATHVEATVVEAKQQQGEGKVRGGVAFKNPLFFNSTKLPNRTRNNTNKKTFEVTLTAQGGVALYVFLETPLSGFFSDNLIMVTPWAPQKIRFYLDKSEENEEEGNLNNGIITEEKFKASLRVIWLQKALNYFPLSEQSGSGRPFLSWIFAPVFSLVWFIQNSLIFRLFLFSTFVLSGIVLAYRR